MKGSGENLELSRLKSGIGVNHFGQAPGLINTLGVMERP